jgi:hypothetical protein
MMRTFIFFLMLAVMKPVSTFLMAQTFENPSQVSGWENTLQNLLRTHGLLLSQAVEATYNDRSVEPIKKQLFSNSHELATFFSSFLGSREGNEFKHLFDEHIKLGEDYIKASKRNHPTSEQHHHTTDHIAQRALENGNKIAVLFSRWFPSIPNQQWRNMLADHVQMEARLADAYFSNNLNAAFTLREQSLMQLRQLGDMLIQGIQNLQNAKSMP